MKNKNQNSVSLSVKTRMEKYLLGRNDNTPVDVLYELCEDVDPFIRSSVAYNKNAPKELVNKLMFDTNDEIRAIISKRNDISREDVFQMAFDSSNAVRHGLARNRNTPVEFLKVMCNYQALRISVAGNTSCPTYILEELSKDKDEFVRGYVASNTSTPKTVLSNLELDDIWWVRELAVANHRLPLKE